MALLRCFDYLADLNFGVLAPARGHGGGDNDPVGTTADSLINTCADIRRAKLKIAGNYLMAGLRGNALCQKINAFPVGIIRTGTRPEASLCGQAML